MKPSLRRCLIMIALLFCMTPLTAIAQDAVGYVVFVKGAAQIERGGQTFTAEVKSAVLKGDVIKTEGKSLVKILFNDDTILTVSEKSRFSVNEYLYDAQRKQSQSLYKLIIGKLRVIVGRSTLKITTETAVAGARGTVFEIAYDSATNTTVLSVIEGSVELKNIKSGVKGTQLVTAGNRSSVAGSEPPKPPAPMPGGGQGGEVMLPGIEPPLAPVAVNELVINNGRGTTTPPIHQTPLGYTKTGIHVVFP